MQEYPVRRDQDKRLEYVPDDQGNRIPDFSNCGYAGGDRAIPSPPVRLIVGPSDGDDGARIQAGIDFVAQLPIDRSGFRGTVLLPPANIKWRVICDC